MEPSKTFQNMTADDMLEHAKESLKDTTPLTPEQEDEQDAEAGYFEDD